MALVQYDSETVQGLQVLIDHQTGKVYASLSALARLIDKADSSVRHHEKALIERGTKVDRLEAEIITHRGGVQKAKLYSEDFISSLLVKYEYSDLVKVCVLGINAYLKELAGVTPVTDPLPSPQKKAVNYSKVHFLYIFEDKASLIIKVGITSNLVKRHSSLECSSGRDLTLRYKRKFNSRESAYALEQLIHNRLKFNRMNGEWFDIAYDELPDTVKKLLA